MAEFIDSDKMFDEMFGLEQLDEGHTVAGDLYVSMAHMLKYEIAKGTKQSPDWIETLIRNRKELYKDIIKGEKNKEIREIRKNPDAIYKRALNYLKNPKYNDGIPFDKFPKERPEDYTIDNFADPNYIHRKLKENIDTDHLGHIKDKMNSKKYIDSIGKSFDDD